MNERIKELANQADAYALETIGDKWVGWEEIAPEWVECRDRKFADLIVKECCEVAHCNFHVDGLTLGNIMKEYFGVE